MKIAFFLLSLTYLNNDVIGKENTKIKHYYQTLLLSKKLDSKTKNRIKKYAPIIENLAEEMGVDPKLALSIAWTESYFRPFITSNTGDVGIMQVQPSTQKYILKKKFDQYKIVYWKILKKYNKSHEIYENLFTGVLYLKYLSNKFKNNTAKIIVAYNRGPSGTLKLIRKKYPIKKLDYYKKVKKRINYIASFKIDKDLILREQNKYLLSFNQL